MASEMIERVARALEPAAWKDDDGRPGGVLVLETRRRLAEARARRVLFAMREPSEAMLASVIVEPSHLYGVDGRGVDYQRDMKAAVLTERAVLAGQWGAMIDAALAE